LLHARSQQEQEGEECRIAKRSSADIGNWRNRRIGNLKTGTELHATSYGRSRERKRKDRARHICSTAGRSSTKKKSRTVLLYHARKRGHLEGGGARGLKRFFGCGAKAEGSYLEDREKTVCLRKEPGISLAFIFLKNAISFRKGKRRLAPNTEKLLPCGDIQGSDCTGGGIQRKILLGHL